jgi:hypothetical protein
MSFALLGLLLVAQTSTTATTGESREDALFGDDEEEEKPQELEEESIVPGAEPGQRGVIDELEETLGATQDYLDIGGLFWLQLVYYAKEEGDAEKFPLASPSFLDLYLDARPTDRVRAFVLGRLFYDFTVTPGDVDQLGRELQRTRVLLDQYWVKLDILEYVFITAGAERIRWGVGQIWNATDFINAQRRDPTALFDLRLGVPMLKVHVPIESLGWNFYAIANLDGASSPEEVGGAFRAEFVLGPAELALTGAVRKDAPQQLGADVSFGLWLFDIRAGFGIAHRIRTPFFRGDPDLSDGIQIEDLQAVERVDRSDEWIPQVLASADITIAYSEQDTITFGAEYFFNDFGISNPDLYPLLFAEGTFNPFYVGRHYAGVFVFLASPGTWDDTSISLSGLGNLSDRSFLTRLQYSVRFFNYLTVNAYAIYSFGELGSLHLGYDVPPSDRPVPGVFENGFELVPTFLELGVALTLDL